MRSRSRHHISRGPLAFRSSRILKERGKLHLVKGLLIPEGSTVLEAAGPTPSDFDHLPLLIVNGDYRASSNRQTNYDAVAAINASPTRAVSSAAVMDLDAPEFAASSTAPPT